MSVRSAASGSNANLRYANASQYKLDESGKYIVNE